MADFPLIEQASLAMVAGAYKEGKVYSQLPTNGDGDFSFTRATSATRVNSEGFIEKGYENLLLQSNNFDTTWNKSGVTVESGYEGYDGSNDAWLLTKLSISNRIEQSISGSGVTTFSAYLKAGTLNWGILNIGGVSRYFDLENGTLGTTSGVGSYRIDFGIESVGNGWYRCFVTSNQSYNIVRIYPANADGDNTGPTGSIYIQDAQLNQGLVAYPYLETTTAPVYGGLQADTPRLNYVGDCPELLIEPSRTNSIKHSEYFLGEPGWFSGSLVYGYDSTILNPENYYGCTTALGTSHKRYAVISGISVGTKLSYSIFAKSNSNANFTFGSPGSVEQATFNINTGTLISQGSSVDSYDIVDYSNGWKRYVVNTTFQDVFGNGQAYVQISWSDAIEPAYLYGLQLEQDVTYPTSYIPTYGSSQTRAAEVATSTFNSSSTGTISLSLGEVPQDYFTVLGESFEAGTTRNDIAIAYSPTALKVSLNGTIVVNATGTYDTSSLSSLQLGHSNGSDQGNHPIKDLIMFNAFLTDTELNALTV